MYSIICGGTPDEWQFETSSSLIAKLDPAIPLQAAHIQAIRELERDKCRYSNQHFDVLSAARRAIGKSRIEPFEQAWVAAMLRNAA